MIKAVYKNGRIEPVDPLPVGWVEGQELFIDEMCTIAPEAADDWYLELQRLVAEVPQDEHARVLSAIAEHRAEAKMMMRREWGLE